MRTIAEIAHSECKISLFTVNQKFIVKFEQGPVAFELKVDQLDIDEASLRTRLGESIDVGAIFRDLHEIRARILE